MPRIKDTTDRQSTFLRAFHLHPAGPPPEAWPSPAILRRWLRHPGFRHAYDDMQRTLKSIVAFQSLTTGLAAARTLHDTLHATLHDTLATPTPPAPAPAPAEVAAPSSPNPEPRTPNPLPPRLALEHEKLRHRTGLAFLRLSHARLTLPPRRRPRPRNSAPTPPPEPAQPEREETIEEAAIRLMHPNCRPEVAIAFMKGEPHPYYDQEMADGNQHDQAGAPDEHEDARSMQP